VWTYNLAALSQPLYRVRRLIGDTQIGAQLLQDEEIADTLATEGSLFAAAALCCENIAATFSRQVDRTLSGMSLTNSQKVTQYLLMARTLRRKAALDGVTPVVGGISQGDKRAVEEDDDRTVPVFTRQQFGFAGNGLPPDADGDNPALAPF